MNEKEKLAYLAGIIDGEGTIAIAKAKIKEGRKNHLYSLRMSAANSDKGLVDWLKENFGGSIHILREEEGNHKKGYQWVLGSKDTYKLLKGMKDYLVIKKEQADIGIEFYKKTIWHVSGERVPIWLNTKREEYFQRMKDLHL
ncbi:hypothetical protein KAT21_05420 [Candidatus Bathyarchaeota archaeon]|nr:hypothetical protein [Candidatus Bathyarchaeota archaeon]